MDINERFWRKVKKGDGCWLWTASKYRNGYGQFVVSEGVLRTAHRVAWTLLYGEPPREMQVMHICDVRACVNPAHLRLGTCQENMRDKMAKGRGSRGESQGNSKLTEVQVEQIRARYSAGEKQRDLAADFGVTQSHLSRLTRGEEWSHVGGERQSGLFRRARGSQHHKAKLSEQDVLAIRARSAEGESNLSIAKGYDVSAVLIGLIVRRRIWRHV